MKNAIKNAIKRGLSRISLYKPIGNDFMNFEKYKRAITTREINRFQQKARKESIRNINKEQRFFQ